MKNLKKRSIYLFILIAINVGLFSICQARTENVFVGDVGEKYMDYLLTSSYSPYEGKWKKINGEIGRNGIDGLYVRRHKNGAIKKVLIGESKYGSSMLGNTKYGRQMSDFWVERKVQTLIDNKEKQLAGSKHWKQKNRLEREINDYKQIKKHLANKDTVRKQVYKTKMKDGRLHVKRYDVKDVQKGKVKLKRKVGSGELDKGIALSNSEVEKIKNPKKQRFHIRERNKFFTRLKKELQQDGISQKEAEKIVRDIKGGKITDGKDLKYARNDAVSKVNLRNMNRSIKKHIPQRFQKNFTKYLKFVERNKNFRSVFAKSLFSLRVIGIASTVLEFKFLYDWTNNQISTRKLINNTSSLVCAAVGYKVGQHAGQGIGYAAGIGLNFFRIPVDPSTSGEVGKFTGAAAGAAIGAWIGQETSSAYFDLKDKASQEQYVFFLKKHLSQHS